MIAGGEPLMRDVVDASLRKHGVMIGRGLERTALAARAAEFVEEARDWEAAEAYLVARFAHDPNHLSGAFLGALRDRASWLDVREAALEHAKRVEADRAKQAPPQETRDPVRKDNVRVSARPPIAECNCGGPIGDYFDKSLAEPELQGRWFCRLCGLEWVKLGEDRAGFRDKAPRFGGAADPWQGLEPVVAQAARPKKTKRLPILPPNLPPLPAAPAGG